MRSEDTPARSLSALGKTDEAKSEMEAFEVAARQIPKDWFIFNNRVDTVLPIARAMMSGELLYRQGKRRQAFAALIKGIRVEDSLVYDEPPGWMLPVRHALGALLMGDGRVKQAEKVYREDLKRNRGNGWGLLGLKQALLAQGKSKEAAALAPALASRWRKADVAPKSSCYCEYPKSPAVAH